MLTARDEKESRIMGLEIGADDYLAKPFEPRELSLRVANILKRARPPRAPPAESVRFGQFVFHLARGELRRGEEVIRLTDREREMLRVLDDERRRDRAAPGAGRQRRSVSERTVDVQVNRLRRKIERDPGNPLIVQTVRGVGYRLVAATMSGSMTMSTMTSLDEGIGRLRNAAGHLVGRGECRGERPRATCRVAADHPTVGPLHPLAEVGDAERALCPFAPDHHRADGGAAIGRRLPVHGPALESGDELSVVGGDAGNRDADRRLQDLPAGCRPRAAAPHRPGPARPGGRFPARARNCRRPGRSRSSRSSTRRCRTISASRSACRSGSIPSAAPRSSKSASSSTTPSCACLRGAPTFTIRIPGFSWSGWSRLRSSCSPSRSLFLRNQIRPIVRLADAAEAFGKGREAPNFRPRGAREVRRAAAAFLEMKGRVERAIEQRTTMLAGVSHDLRTILTRFKLELALARRRRRKSRPSKRTSTRWRRCSRPISPLPVATQASSRRRPTLPPCSTSSSSTPSATAIAPASTFHGQPEVTVRPAAFKRCLANLVTNASRFASTVAITGHRDHRWLTVTVDDDGPGIPLQLREDVFKPFLRLDDARNQDEGGTGLGLAIARDIARSHGGDITLGDSPLGGLRATVRVPV